MTAWFDPRGTSATAVQLELPLESPCLSPVEPSDSSVRDNKRMRGQHAYLSGLAAEESVARHYAARGHEVLARRWRGQGGEIDLILQDGEVVVFVEVKKSHSFDAALLSFGPRQRRRIIQSAGEFLGRLEAGQMTHVRLDLAMVDGRGAVRLLENAFSEDD